MSIIGRPHLPPPPAAESQPRSERLRVITAGSVGNMEARLGTSGFDVVAVAETEHALIDAVSADEPDAIVVEADLCDSLEHVRDLAPDAVLIAVGDHTPAGALGRIEPGVSGTVMAGLLHALVADGVGAAAVWGLVPAFRPGAAVHVSRLGGSILSAKADIVRAHLANLFSDHAELVTAAVTVTVTVSATLLLTLNAPLTHDLPERIPPVPPPAEERAPQHPVFVVDATTQAPAHSPLGNESEPGDRPEPNGGDSGKDGRHDDQGERQNGDAQGENQNGDDQGENQNGDDQGENQNGDDQGENQNGDDQGENQNGDAQGEDEGNNGQSGNQTTDDQGGNQTTDDQGENN